MSKAFTAIRSRISDIFSSTKPSMAYSGPLVSTSRVYSDVIPSRPPSYWDYESLEVEWGSPAPYLCCESIGKGKYSEVFRGVNKYNDQSCVIKVLKPVKMLKVRREISILQNLSGGPNIVQLLDLVKESVTQTPCLILEWTDNVDFRRLYPMFTIEDIAYYMYKILEALNYCHSQGIMHRDIKPHNIMIDPVNRKLSVIDWGLAEFYHPEKEYNVRVATRYFKAPELLVDYKYYDYSLDIWSFGCLLAGIVFRQEPFFHGNSMDDQLKVIAQVLGTKELIEYLKKYNIELDQKYETLAMYARQPWSKKVKRVPYKHRNLCTPEVIDLIDKCLVYDHRERLTAQQAMDHPFFAEERQRQGQEATARSQRRTPRTQTTANSTRRRPEDRQDAEPETPI